MRDAGVFSFLTCYLLVFLLEIVRLYLKQVARLSTLEGLVLTIGIVVHGFSLYRFDLLQNNHFFASGAGWFFVLSFALALVTGYLKLVYSKTQFGLFLTPLILLVIIAGVFTPDANFSKDVTCRCVRAIHAGSIMFATLSLSIGAIAGAMFFLQRYRLKHKVFSAKLTLPSLEWLGRAVRHATNLAVILLGIGVAAGYYLKLFAIDATERPNGIDPFVIGATILFIVAIISRLRQFYKKNADVNADDAVLTFICCVVLFALFLFATFEIGGHWNGLSSKISLDSLEKSATAHAPETIDGKEAQ